MRRYLTFVSCMLLFAILLTGCGGGGHSGSGSGGTGGSGGPGTGGGGGTSLTPAQITATISATQTRFGQLLDTVSDTAARDQQLVNFLKTQPAVADAELGKPGCVSARLVNNEYYVIVDNRDPVLPSATGIGSIPAHSAAKTATRTIAASPATTWAAPHDTGSGYEIPQSKQARLLGALNTDLFGNAVPQIADLLQRRGYNVITQQATVENLRSISNDGIFYLDAHGSLDYDPVTKTNFWSVWTDTPRTEQNDALYQADLTDGSLVYMTATNGLTSNNKRIFDTHYAFTNRFVHKYNWSFAPHSLVYLNICYGSYPGISANDSLRALQQPAGSTIGWDFPVAGRAIPDAYYIFDRMLGTNSISPIQNTLQRPFASNEVIYGLSNYGMTQDTTKSGTANLRFDGAPKFILTLQIVTMETRERIAEGPIRGKTQLILHGAFGTQQGTVKIGGTEVPVTSWARDQVVCQPADIPGDGYSGDVEVSVDGHDSNAVALTQWHGKVTYQVDTFPSPVTPIQSRITVDAYFRADTHSFRNYPEQAPQTLLSVPFRVSQGSQCHWEVIGGPPLGTAWAGPTSADLPFGLNGTANPPYGTGYILSGTLNRNDQKVNFSFNFLGCTAPYQVPGAPVGAVLPTFHDINLTSQQSGVSSVDGYGVFQTNLPLTFGSDDVISARTLNGSTSQLHPTLQFSDFVPTYAPDITKGEDQDPH